MSNSVPVPRFDPAELIEGYRQGLTMRRRIDLLTRQITSAQKNIVGTIDITAIDGPELYRADTSGVDLATCGRFFGLLVVRSEIGSDFKALQARLSDMALGRAVIIKAEPGRSPIQRRRFSVSHDTSDTYDRVVTSDLQSAQGLISEVDLAENLLRLRPQSWIRATLSGDEYTAHIVDSGGAANISIEPRHSGVRDIHLADVTQ